MAVPLPMNIGVDLTNEFLVAATRNRIVVANPPHASDDMTPERALAFAAWLVEMAQPLTQITFEEIRAAIAT